MVPIPLKSALPPVTGDVYVVYRGGTRSKAEVYGEITKAADGEVAELFAQQFPFRNAPVRAGAVILHPAGATAGYEFQGDPGPRDSLPGRTVPEQHLVGALAISGIATLYVSLSGTTSDARACGQPVCREYPRGDHSRLVIDHCDLWR
jgi:hypothetical protein